MIGIPGVGVAITAANVAGVMPRSIHGVVTGYNVVLGKLSLFVAIAILMLALSLIARLLSAYNDADESSKRSLKIIIITLFIALITAIITGIFFPLLLGGSDAANAFSSIAATIFIVSLAYSVLRYSFLNVRLVVIRSVGYIASLALILLISVMLQTFIFGTLNGAHRILTPTEQISLAFLFGLAALSFQPISHQFAKVTTSIFFKDQYDSQIFISNFNAKLVKSIDLDVLIQEAAADIQQTLKASYCSINIDINKEGAQFSRSTDALSSVQKRALSKLFSIGTHEQLISRQYSTSIKSPRMAQINNLLIEADTDVVFRLAEVQNKSNTIIGYIALGSKKNGEGYNLAELNDLKIVGNELQLAIQNAVRFEEIQRFAVTLQEEVDLKTHRLQKANKRLKELDNIKDDFISMASHQLRTPLTAVKGYLSMVLDGDAGRLNGTQTQMLHQAFTSSQRMVFLITDLLNVSRLKTGKFLIDPVPLRLDKLIDEEVTQLQETAALKRIAVKYHKPKEFPELQLDEVKTRQVIMNFIDNAIYYTPEGGRIDVRLIDKLHTIELRVTDNGIGVPRSEQHHLFTKFYRATNARKTRPDGTGLGLFMAQKVVMAQGGYIIFESEENKGSTFGFSLPKAGFVPEENPTVVEAKASNEAVRVA